MSFITAVPDHRIWLKKIRVTSDGDGRAERLRSYCSMSSKRRTIVAVQENVMMINTIVEA
jgi:hypothetical protein